MRETLLNHLFKIISTLRRIETSLINDQQPECAAKVGEAKRALSCFRDKLITAQLTNATDKLNNAADQLQATTQDLQACINTREAAGNKLEAILGSIPAAIALLNTLTD
ncbi:MAG: hypothetical protein KAR40_11585 [Candidatus Sabulitectum sp.]|nr:hypothetical protein [Candidatus Sabulitectum sp.]